MCVLFCNASAKQTRAIINAYQIVPESLANRKEPSYFLFADNPGVIALWLNQKLLTVTLLPSRICPNDPCEPATRNNCEPPLTG
jgi:hypothetical protein